MACFKAPKSQPYTHCGESGQRKRCISSGSTYLGVYELFEQFIARAVVVAPLPDGSGRLELDFTLWGDIPRRQRVARVASDPRW